MTDSHAGTIQTREESGPVASRRERWLFVDGADSFGGHEVMLLRWLEELAAQRTVDTYLLARSEQLSREGARHAVVIDLPPPRRFTLLREANVFVRGVLGLKPDLVVVAEGCPLAQAHFVLLARLLSVKVVIYVPLVQTTMSMSFGSGRQRDAIVRHWYANLPHAWITLTSEQVRDFQGWSRVRRPVLVLPNTVSRAIEGSFTEMTRKAEHPSRRLRIVVLGRIEAHQKGLDQLLDYLVAQPALGERMTLSFVGNGPFEAQIRERLHRDPSLAKWVALHPWSPTREVLQQHDVLLMTSRYEGVPLVMLEAMAVGLPVIAPDLPGTRAFLSGDCLFERNDMQYAFRCIERFMDTEPRIATARRNRSVFESLASNAAFAVAVKSITQALRTLGRTSLQRRSA